ncbi:MAG: U32 family peptidase [Planctomycetia bacterium]|nr:U32 family peptidase [Planctomycetia bacterium]
MAPSGNLECMNAAVRAGADEVYMGISGFGARRFAKNFSVQEYCDAVGEAHRYGTAVNITLNTIMAEEEVDSLHESLEMLYAAGVDAVIVQDLGFADFLKTYFPDWPRHASTQLSIATPTEAKWAESHGFSRLVLARELSLNEISDIRHAVSAELEVFASGALCIACSGKCFLSSFIGGRSGNRGMCTQPCRQRYQVVGNPKNTGFFLSSRDQWQEFPEIAQLFALGVEVIKLEGRMKSPEYVFEAVRYYREMIDTLKNASESRIQQILERIQEVPIQKNPHPGIERLFNRGYSKGYLHENDPDFINTAFSASWGVPGGKIKKRKIRLTQSLRNGDGIVFLDADLQKISGTNVSRIVRKKNGEIVTSASRGEEIDLNVEIPAQAAFLYKTYDYELNRQLANDMKLTRRRTPLRVRAVAQCGKPLELDFSVDILGKTFNVQGVSEEPLSPSKNQNVKMKRTTFLDALDRFGETPFILDRNLAEIVYDTDVFIPKSVLNQVRQKIVQELERLISVGLRRESVKMKTEFPIKEREYGENTKIEPVFSAAVMTEGQARACREVGIQKIYRLEPPVHFGNILRPESPTQLERLAGSLFDAVTWAQEGKFFALDWTFHVANSGTIQFLHRAFPTAETFFLSPELSEKTVRKLALLTQKQDIPRLGLVIYGFLYGMYTRKTLFQEPLTKLLNQDGRPVWVSRNSDSENPTEMTGSRVYYGNRMDISAQVAENPISGIAELRLDFTLETPEEVQKIAKNILARGWNQAQGFSYGYEKGIF